MVMNLSYTTLPSSFRRTKDPLTSLYKDILVVPGAVLFPLPPFPIIINPLFLEPFKVKVTIFPCVFNSVFVALEPAVTIN